MSVTVRKAPAAFGAKDDFGWFIYIQNGGGGRGWRHNFQILDELHNFFWNGHIVDTDVSNGNMKICELSFHGELGL